MNLQLIRETRAERDILAIAVHPEIWEHISGPIPTTMPQMLASVRDKRNRFFIAGNGDGVVVILKDALGARDLHFAFRERWRGTGKCLDAVLATLAVVCKTEPETKVIFVRFFPNRPDVRRFVEKLGFKLERETVRIGPYFMEEWCRIVKE
jgi:hypothetical protein